ncbi:MAG: Chromosomal replication initiator protein DnaA [Thermoanaerobaculia bacterium]|nr:Chromosomal replication initiator protein DnaA [Thermoanaerobaculia bacterium]
MERQTAWDKILQHLKNRVHETDFETWFRDSRQSSESHDLILVRVKSPLFVTYISDNFAQQIAEAASLAGFGEREIRFGSDDSFPGSVAPHKSTPETRRRTSALNPEYTFENFVTGESNRLAHAAALRVADQPTRQYNPLFVCGGSGLGKTHLMQAIGHRRLSRHPGDRILYMTSESFVNEVAQGIRFNRMEDVRHKLRAADLFLVDDVQFFVGKEASLTELFHTFNALYDDGKQIVFSSDAPPREINGLTDRLKSRFEWGLIVDIQPPEFETRVAILRKKAETHNIDLPDDVAYLLAARCKKHVRELESSLSKVKLIADLRGEALTAELTRDVLPDLIGGRDDASSTPTEILKAVAAHFGLKPSELRQRTKKGAIVFPRQVAMYVMKEATSMSFPEIGRLFGDRHHTTALHAVRKISALREEDPELNRQITNLIAQFRP